MKCVAVPTYRKSLKFYAGCKIFGSFYSCPFCYFILKTSRNLLFLLKRRSVFPEPHLNLFKILFEQIVQIWNTAGCNFYNVDRRKIRLIEGNAKCRHLKQLTCKGSLRRLFICMRPRTPYSSSLTHCLHLCTVYSTYINLHREGGRGDSWTRVKIREATIHKAELKIPTRLTVSPGYKLW